MRIIPKLYDIATDHKTLFMVGGGIGIATLVAAVACCHFRKVEAESSSQQPKRRLELPDAPSVNTTFSWPQMETPPSPREPLKYPTPARQPSPIVIPPPLSPLAKTPPPRLTFPDSPAISSSDETPPPSLRQQSKLYKEVLATPVKLGSTMAKKVREELAPKVKQLEESIEAVYQKEQNRGVKTSRPRMSGVLSVLQRFKRTCTPSLLGHLENPSKHELEKDDQNSYDELLKLVEQVKREIPGYIIALQYEKDAFKGGFLECELADKQVIVCAMITGLAEPIIRKIVIPGSDRDVREVCKPEQLLPKLRRVLWKLPRNKTSLRQVIPTEVLQPVIDLLPGEIELKNELIKAQFDVLHRAMETIEWKRLPERYLNVATGFRGALAKLNEWTKSGCDFQAMQGQHRFLFEVPGSITNLARKLAKLVKTQEELAPKDEIVLLDWYRDLIPVHFHHPPTDLVEEEPIPQVQNEFSKRACDDGEVEWRLDNVYLQVFRYSDQCEKQFTYEQMLTLSIDDLKTQLETGSWESPTEVTPI